MGSHQRRLETVLNTTIANQAEYSAGCVHRSTNEVEGVFAFAVQSVSMRITESR